MQTWLTTYREVIDISERVLDIYAPAPMKK